MAYNGTALCLWWNLKNYCSLKHKSQIELPKLNISTSATIAQNRCWWQVFFLGLQNFNFMTAKEKAKELIERYHFVYIQNYTSQHEVKECAIIAVNEIIDVLSKYTGMHDQDFFDADVRFYEEVKTEIENYV